MDNFNVLDKYSELRKNIVYLEEEGKTVVMLALDNVP
jgi:hypothetical protein